MSNNLLTIVMYYALFNKKLQVNENDIMKAFPKNVFGVFSTIRRSRKLKTYPIDIHGCIGYWDANFSSLNKTVLYENLLRVAHDSLWSDNRRNSFTPIETEPQSVLEIDFMMNPIYSINKDTGIIAGLNTMFTNNRFGIIIQTRDKMQKATYLPNVFPNISWKNLVVSIKNKANITSNDFELFAYKIIQIKSPFSILLTGDFFSKHCIFHYSRFLIDNMKTNLNFPFIYACKKNILEWNAKDDVRNIATLSDVFRYIQLYPEIASKTENNTIKRKILAILKNLDPYSSQSISFLGYIYKLFNIDNRLFCKKLLQSLPFAEKEFESPEIIIGLNKANCNMKEYGLTYNSNDSIFKMNWVIQAIISYNKMPSMKQILILEHKIDDILRTIKTIETNFIAVAFEASCFIYAKYTKPSLLNKIFGLWFELEQRKNCYNVLNTFLDKSARVDITGHIINGYVALRTHLV